MKNLLKICTILIFLVSLLGCTRTNFDNDADDRTFENPQINGLYKGNLSDYEIKEIAKSIIAKSNYCCTFLAPSMGDYSIIDISHEHDRYDRYIVTANLKVSDGEKYEKHTVNMYFRYNATKETYIWNHDMVFKNEYLMDDFKIAVNWGKDTTIEADNNSFYKFKKGQNTQDTTTQDTTTQIQNNSPTIEKWNFDDYNTIPFSIKDFYSYCKDNEWYDDGIFSSFMSIAYPNDHWEYRGSFSCNMTINPYGYTGFQIYSHECEKEQKIYTYLVPISPAGAPEVYAFDEISETMKRVWVDGRILD